MEESKGDDLVVNNYDIFRDIIKSHISNVQESKTIKDDS